MTTIERLALTRVHGGFRPQGVPIAQGGNLWYDAQLRPQYIGEGPEEIVHQPTWSTWGNKTEGKPVPPLFSREGRIYMHDGRPGPGSLVISGPGITKPTRF